MKSQTLLNLQIYQCHDGSWRLLSEDYIDEWGGYKLRNLTIRNVIVEIKRLIINESKQSKL